MAKTRKTERELQELVTQLRSLPLFTRQDAARAGLPGSTLDLMVKTGKFERLAPGLFRHPEADTDYATLDFAVACHIFGPRSAVGGLTALFHYQLTDQPPSRIWLLVPPTSSTKDRRYRLMRTITDSTVEVTDEHHFRIVTPARAVVEAFHFASKTGLQTAFDAAKAAIASRQVTAADLLGAARRLDLESVILERWEALLVLEEPRS